MSSWGRRIGSSLPGMLMKGRESARVLRQRLVLPLLFGSLEQAELSLVTKLLLDPFRRGLQVIAGRLLIHRIDNRQHFFQQVRNFGERDQRSLLRLQVKQFRTGSPLQPRFPVSIGSRFRNCR
jgi:hypothetical protein